MPNPPPGQPITSPGQVNTKSGYPQYGVGPSSANYAIVEAHTPLDEAHWVRLGYFPWFTSMQAAQDYVSGQSSGYGSGGPSLGNPLNGLADIGDFFHRLTEAATWERVGEVLLGGILIYAGVKALSSGTIAEKATSNPVKKLRSKALSVAVPETRLAGRKVAKKVAPKTTAKVASHRREVAKYGAKKPYSPPPTRPARVSHVYHHSSKGTTKTTSKPKVTP